jgi:nickel-dependent lactate racemase
MANAKAVSAIPAIIKKSDTGLNDAVMEASLAQSIESFKEAGGTLNKVLLIPPDMTRLHSYAGKLTNIYYRLLSDTCQVDIMPALGTHMPMTDEEITEMFGADIPKDRFLVHNWRNDVVKVGQVPGDFVKEVSDGLIDYSIDVEINKHLLDPSYDLVISIGQVVPHEVVGMANYTKNIVVGCGGFNIINKSHMLGAVYGMERMMGRDNTPVRKVFDYAEENFLKDIPLLYVLTVTTQVEGSTCVNGLFIGRQRKVFEEAVALSQEKNLNFVDEPFKKVVVYLDPVEFKSTWLGNKSVYRTRMAIADDGDLIVLAPGVRQFGEDAGNDEFIRKYGYQGRDRILELYKTNEDLQNNLSVAAHLIHGSSDGRFRITYAVEKLTKEEVEGVHFNYMSYEEAVKKYNPEKLKDGFNTLEDGETIYYISNPAIGLWALKSKF